MDNGLNTFHITLNFPPQHEGILDSTKTQIINYLKKKQYEYIVGKEAGKKTGKPHYHIGYQCKNRLFNEQRWSTKLIPFALDITKKELETACKHKKHNNWSILINYITKEDENYETSINKTDVSLHKERAETLRPPVKKYMYADDIADAFCKYYSENIENNKTTEDKDYMLIKMFMSTIKDQLKFTVYSRINHDKLLEFAKINYEPKEWGGKTLL